METPATYNGWASTLPSTASKPSLPKVDEFTLAGVRIVSLGSTPLRALSLWYVRTSADNNRRSSRAPTWGRNRVAVREFVRVRRRMMPPQESCERVVGGARGWGRKGSAPGRHDPAGRPDRRSPGCFRPEDVKLRICLQTECPHALPDAPATSRRRPRRAAGVKPSRPATRRRRALRGRPAERYSVKRVLPTCSGLRRNGGRRGAGLRGGIGDIMTVVHLRDRRLPVRGGVEHSGGGFRLLPGHRSPTDVAT